MPPPPEAPSPTPPTRGVVTMEDAEDLRPSKKKVIYSEHKPMSEITSDLRCGIYHQGELRVNRYNPFESYVGSESIGDELVIRGRSNMNRAFDGDIVAVELLPQDQWHESKSLIADDDEDDDEEDVRLVPNSADAPRNANSMQSIVGSSAACPQSSSWTCCRHQVKLEFVGCYECDFLITIYMPDMQITREDTVHVIMLD